MRYVLFGKLNRDWVDKEERVSRSRRKLEELGIKLEAVLYTQGSYDFVDVIATGDPKAALAFSAWYATQGFGEIASMPAYTTDEFSDALKRI
ncbi:MAG: GYD domain-containing protein [Planctomycetota bacterium]